MGTVTPVPAPAGTATPAAPAGTAAPAAPAVGYAVSAGCTGCGACLRTCPAHAIRPTGRPAPPLLVDPGRCTDCGECLEICPADAITRLAARTGAVPVPATTRGAR